MDRGWPKHHVLVCWNQTVTESPSYDWNPPPSLPLSIRHFAFCPLNPTRVAGTPNGRLCAIVDVRGMEPSVFPSHFPELFIDFELWRAESDQARPLREAGRRRQAVRRDRGLLHPGFRPVPAFLQTLRVGGGGRWDWCRGPRRRCWERAGKFVLLLRSSPVLIVCVIFIRHCGFFSTCSVWLPIKSVGC